MGNLARMFSWKSGILKPEELLCKVDKNIGYIKSGYQNF